jgi:hypothetical protein
MLDASLALQSQWEPLAHSQEHNKNNFLDA